MNFKKFNILLLLWLVLTASWCQAQGPVLWGMTSEGGANGEGVMTGKLILAK